MNKPGLDHRRFDRGLSGLRGGQHGEPYFAQNFAKYGESKFRPCRAGLNKQRRVQGGQTVMQFQGRRKIAGKASLLHLRAEFWRDV